MTCAICVWTPARILECVESDAGEPIDCFREAVPDSPFKEVLSHSDSLAPAVRLRIVWLLHCGINGGSLSATHSICAVGSRC